MIVLFGVVDCRRSRDCRSHAHASRSKRLSVNADCPSQESSNHARCGRSCETLHLQVHAGQDEFHMLASVPNAPHAPAVAAPSPCVSKASAAMWGCPVSEAISHHAKEGEERKSWQKAHVAAGDLGPGTRLLRTIRRPKNPASASASTERVKIRYQVRVSRTPATAGFGLGILVCERVSIVA